MKLNIVKHAIALSLLSIVVWQPGCLVANTDCESDDDCKPGRTCQDGECVGSTGEGGEGNGSGSGGSSFGGASSGGSSSGGGSSCGEPCPTGCCSSSGSFCCSPPFCAGDCAFSPCCG
jgi:hypothetical protein